MTSAERHEARYQRRKAAREAKRRAYLDHYDDFDRATSVSALLEAGWAARKGVMWKASVARYSVKSFANARKSHRALRSGADTRMGFYHFQIVERGKPRDVHSLHYTERVIRRAVCTNAMVPILSRSLIYDNGASLDGKGISFAIDRCATHLHRFYREYSSNEGYVLVIDFRKFFDNIAHEPLFRVYDRNFHDKQLNAHCRGYVTATGDSGLYIGPEDSQISAIAFPNRIDHLIKDQWGVRFYGRYMDDSYIIMRSKQELERVRNKLFDEFAKQGIVINRKKTQIVRLRRGFTYLKTQYILMENGRILQKPCRVSIVRQRRKLKAFRRFMDQGKMTLRDVERSYMSWRGSLKKKNARRSIQSMDRLYFSLFADKPWINNKKRREITSWTSVNLSKARFAA